MHGLSKIIIAALWLCVQAEKTGEISNAVLVKSGTINRRPCAGYIEAAGVVEGAGRIQEIVDTEVDSLLEIFEAVVAELEHDGFAGSQREASLLFAPKPQRMEETLFEAGHPDLLRQGSLDQHRFEKTLQPEEFLQFTAR